MKQFLTLTSSLALSALLLTAHAQAPAISPSQAKPAPKRATPYMIQNSKALGQKMVQKSKPADNIRTRVDQLPRPANQ